METFIKEPINQRNMLSALSHHQLETGTYPAGEAIELMAIPVFRALVLRGQELFEDRKRVLAKMTERGPVIRTGRIILHDRAPLFEEVLLNEGVLDELPGHEFSSNCLTVLVKGTYINKDFLDSLGVPLDACLLLLGERVAYPLFVSNDLKLVKNVAARPECRLNKPK